MPAGKTHLKIELFLLPFAGAVALYAGAAPAQTALLALSYVLASLFFSPDLDLRRNSARRRWGILGAIWSPYTKVFKHRGLSHSLLWGPITRLGYLSLVTVAVAIAITYLWGWPMPNGFSLPWLTSVLTWGWPILLGIWLPHLVHVLVDSLHTALTA